MLTFIKKIKKILNQTGCGDGEIYKYLGVFLDMKLTFAKHVKDVVINVKHRMNILKVVCSFNW